MPAAVVIEPLVTERFAFDVEVLARAARAGLRLEGLPVRWSHVEASRRATVEGRHRDGGGRGADPSAARRRGERSCGRPAGAGAVMAVGRDRRDGPGRAGPLVVPGQAPTGAWTSCGGSARRGSWSTSAPAPGGCSSGWALGGHPGRRDGAGSIACPRAAGRAERCRSPVGRGGAAGAGRRCGRRHRARRGGAPRRRRAGAPRARSGRRSRGASSWSRYPRTSGPGATTTCDSATGGALAPTAGPNAAARAGLDVVRCTHFHSWLTPIAWLCAARRWAAWRAGRRGGEHGSCWINGGLQLVTDLERTVLARATFPWACRSCWWPGTRDPVARLAAEPRRGGPRCGRGCPTR